MEVIQDKPSALSLTSHANSFLFQARTIQRESGIKLVGEIRLTPEAAERIEKFIYQNNIAAPETIPPAEYRDHLERLFTKFEGVCARRRIFPETPHILEHCYHQLADEYFRNVTSLNMSPSKLVVPTLLSTFPLDVAFNAPPLSNLLSQQHWLLDRALTSNPGDPVSFLLRGYNNLLSIEDILRANGKTMTTAAKLRLAISTTGQTCHQRIEEYFESTILLQEDPRFTTHFRSSPWVFGLAVTLHGSKAVDYLNEVKNGTEAMMKDSRLVEVHDKRGTMLSVAIRHPKNPVESMLSILAQEKRILDLAHQLGHSPGAKELRDLCLRTPRAAERLEERLALLLEEKNAKDLQMI